MKKILLLCTLACAGSLIGMEPTSPRLQRSEKEQENLGVFEQLPKELRQEIIKAALEANTTGDPFNKAIQAIQNASLIYGGVQLDETAAIDILQKAVSNNMDLLKNILPKDWNRAMLAINILLQDKLNNLKDFTKIVHILADHFRVSTRYIARTMGASLSKKYLDLGISLMNFAGDKRKYAQNEIIELINQGADVNYNDNFNTMLKLAIKNHLLKNVQLLLQLDAKPTANDLEVAKDEVKSNPDNKEIIKIKNLIEKAMK